LRLEEPKRVLSRSFELPRGYPPAKISSYEESLFRELVRSRALRIVEFG